MKDQAAARQYATALHRAAVESGTVAAVQGELMALRRLIEQVPQAAQFWQHPQIGSQAKLKAVQELLNRKFSSEMLRFLVILLDKGRSVMLPEVMVQFNRLQLQSEGKMVAQVTTAQTLDQAEEKQLVEKLERKYGKKFILDRKTNPELLGGIRVQVEDTVYDASIRRRLEKLRQTLMPQFRGID